MKMKSKYVKQLFIKEFAFLNTPEYLNNMILMVQGNSDPWSEQITNRLLIKGILFESDEELYGLHKNEIIGYEDIKLNCKFYKLSEYINAILHGDLEAILMLTDNVLLSNKCGKTFKENIINLLDKVVYIQLCNSLKKYCKLMHEDINITSFKKEMIKYYKAIKFIRYVIINDNNIDQFQFTDKDISVLDFIVNSDNKTEIKNKVILNTLYDNEMLNLYIEFNYSLDSLERNYNSFLISFIKENKNKKRKELSLRDIKREEE